VLLALQGMISVQDLRNIAMDMIMDEACIISMRIDQTVVPELHEQNRAGKIDSSNQVDLKSNQSTWDCQERKYKMNPNLHWTTVLSPPPKDSQCCCNKEGS
jgi:hypothetical protein